MLKTLATTTNHLSFIIQAAGNMSRQTLGSERTTSSIILCWTLGGQFFGGSELGGLRNSIFKISRNKNEIIFNVGKFRGNKIIATFSRNSRKTLLNAKLIISRNFAKTKKKKNFAATLVRTTRVLDPDESWIRMKVGSVFNNLQLHEGRLDF